MDQLDQFDETEDSVNDPSERWWIYLWTGWGGLVAALVYWFDRNPLTAAAWLGAGLAIGHVGKKVLDLYCEYYSQWVHDRFRDDRRADRMFELLESGQDETREYEALLVEDCFVGLLSMPPLLGLFMGVLLGAPVGTLATLDPELGAAASMGALSVAIFFSIPLMFCAGLAIGLGELSLRPSMSKPRRLRRVLALVLSPLLLLPAAWHCVSYFARRLVLRLPSRA